jgi:hypothetical protein
MVIELTGAVAPFSDLVLNDFKPYPNIEGKSYSI